MVSPSSTTMSLIHTSSPTMESSNSAIYSTSIYPALTIITVTSTSIMSESYYDILMSTHSPTPLVDTLFTISVSASTLPDTTSSYRIITSSISDARSTVATTPETISTKNITAIEHDTMTDVCY